MPTDDCGAGTLARRAGNRAGACIVALTTAALTPRSIAFAQQPPEPAFEVDSIKRNTSELQTSYGLPHGDRFTAVNTNLKSLVALAWNLRAYEVMNAPGWVDSGRYDITARTAESNIPEERARLVLQSLFAERFKLAAHRETREESVYALTMAKADIKVQPSKEGTCAHFTPDNPPPRPEPGQPPPPPPCGAMSVGANHLSGFRITTAFLIRGLSELLGRPVLDQTGYTGAFDFNLEFRMEGLASWGPGGFVLQPQRAPVDVLVIDHIERPTEN